jgi:hypothetical protein
MVGGGQLAAQAEFGAALNARNSYSKMHVISCFTRGETTAPHLSDPSPPIVVYTFKQKDGAMRETAQMAVTLQKGKSGWLITGFAWAGTKPKPAVAAAAAK